LNRVSCFYEFAFLKVNFWYYKRRKCEFGFVD